MRLAVPATGPLHSPARPGRHFLADFFFPEDFAEAVVVPFLPPFFFDAAFFDPEAFFDAAFFDPVAFFDRPGRRSARD